MTQNIDFTVSWNRKVNSVYNNGYDYPKEGQDPVYFEKILCDPGILKPEYMLTGTYYKEETGSTLQSWVSGYTT